MTPKEMRNKWAAALRSGKYKQTKFGLHDAIEDSYCCLGVACRLFGTEATEGDLVAGKWARFKDSYRLHESASLPRDISTMLGLEQIHRAHLVKMNDHEDKTFAEIADYIDTIEDTEESE